MSGLIWWVAAGVLIIAELFTGTFYLLMIALGMITGGRYRACHGRVAARADGHGGAGRGRGAAALALRWLEAARRCRSMNSAKAALARRIAARNGTSNSRLANPERAGMYRIAALDGNRLIVTAKR